MRTPEIMDEALDRIKNHFEALYGKDVSESILPRVQQLLQRHGRHPGELDAGLRSMSLNQRDALLITYVDQVQQTGLAPLKVLDRFMEKHLRGIVSGVHLLPFYPFSSDDGFSVLDWFAVD